SVTFGPRPLLPSGELLRLGQDEDGLHLRSCLRHGHLDLVRLGRGEEVAGATQGRHDRNDADQLPLVAFLKVRFAWIEPAGQAAQGSIRTAGQIKVIRGKFRHRGNGPYSEGINLCSLAERDE